MMPRLALFAYVLTAIITFGYAINRQSCSPQPTFCADDMLVVTAVNQAIWWPLYWSAKVQYKEKHDADE
jgi:hypothetical protein